MSESEEKKAAEGTKANAEASGSSNPTPTGNDSPSAGRVQVPAGQAAPGGREGEGPRGGGPRGGGGGGGGRGGERRGQGPRPRRDDRDQGDDLNEKVVFINRCAKVVKGGRRFSFSALVVVGDEAGKVGIGFGKANEVADCIRKASGDARSNMVEITRDGTTIPHEIIGEHGGGRVLLRPASEGTGIIAGGAMRAVLEVSGITDVLAKNMGSNNHANVVKATLEALTRLRTRDQIYSARGKKVEEKKAL